MLAWLVAAVVVAFQLAFSAAPVVAKRHMEDDQKNDYWRSLWCLCLVDPVWVGTLLDMIASRHSKADVIGY